MVVSRVKIKGKWTELEPAAQPKKVTSTAKKQETKAPENKTEDKKDETNTTNSSTAKVTK